MAAPATAPPLVLDAHADTLDHVVRAVARSGFLPQALQLVLASPEHLHDPELLYRTRGVWGAGGATLLMRAVARLDVARVVEILGACPTPAARTELLACGDDEGWTALHLACDYKRRDEEAALRMVELLLASGADLFESDARDEWACLCAIHFAARWSARLVRRLVQAGASIDGDVKGESTLVAAASAGTAQGARMIPQLVALGARATRGNRGDGAMFSFAKHPFEGVQPTDDEVVAALNALVGVGCSLTEEFDVRGWTLLDDAAVYGNAPVVRALLLLGVPATTNGLVHGAKYPDVVRVLLAAGASINERGGLGSMHHDCTPLMAAARRSVLESVEVLLAAGASVDHDELASSISNSFDFDPRVTEALLATGVRVNARNCLGWTTLHVLAAHHHGQVLQPWAASAARLLLQRGADVHAVDKAGRTPAQLVHELLHDGELHRLLLEAAAA